jgi:HEAT repeat protein
MSMRIGLVLLMISLSLSAKAAIPNGKKTAAHALAPATVSLSKTAEILNLPLENRVLALREQGESGYRNLVHLMFDEHQDLDTRWRSITAVARLAGALSKPELEKARHRREWFMRNAALVAMTEVDRTAALEWAKELIDDKALVVRAAAVDVIADLGGVEDNSLLWSKLNERINFRGNQSLFIRRRILETLAKNTEPGSEGRFIQVLHDRDESLHPMAIAALEKLTHQHLGKSKEPLAFRKTYWLNWWKSRAEM